MIYYPTDPYDFLWNYHFEREEENQNIEEDESNPTTDDREEFD